MRAGIRHQQMLSHARLVEARFSTYWNVDVNRGRRLMYQWQQQFGAPSELTAFEKPFRRISVAEIRFGDGRMFGVNLVILGGMITEHSPARSSCDYG